MIDGAGAYGGILSYGLTIAVVGSAFLIFLKLWFTDRLDMDEEPKMQMMLHEQEESENDKENFHE